MEKFKLGLIAFTLLVGIKSALSSTARAITTTYTYMGKKVTKEDIPKLCKENGGCLCVVGYDKNGKII